LPEGWDKKQGIIEVQGNDTILSVLQQPGHIVPGVLEVTVVSTSSPFYEIFLKNF
jgi:hypothetical protein